MTAQRIEAAKLVAEGLLSDRRIAEMIGCVEKTIWSWRHRPEFIEAVRGFKTAALEDAQRLYAAQQANRLTTLDELYRNYKTVMRERAEQFAREHPTIPGGKTGLIIKRERVIGLGANSERITEYVIDSEIRNAIESLGKEIGIETGQRSEKKEVSGAGGSPLFSIVELAVELSDDDGEAELDLADETE